MKLIKVNLIIPPCPQMYLTSEEFHATFGMTYTDFLSKPLWKQQAMKKQAGLF